MQVGLDHHLVEQIVIEKLEHERPKVAVGVSLQRQNAQSGPFLQELGHLLPVVDVRHADVVVKKRLNQLTLLLHHIIVLNQSKSQE